MKFEPKLILILLATISTALASLNGQYSGRSVTKPTIKPTPPTTKPTPPTTKPTTKPTTPPTTKPTTPPTTKPTTKPTTPPTTKPTTKPTTPPTTKPTNTTTKPTTKPTTPPTTKPTNKTTKPTTKPTNTTTKPTTKPANKTTKPTTKPANKTTKPTTKPTTVPDNTYNGPCGGGGGVCINTNRVSCETRTIAGKCRGPAVVKCCVSGKKPSWYINQGQYTKTTCLKDRTVKTSGCGPSSLAMGIRVLTNNNISPETLFKEGCDAGLYNGDGYSHHALSTLGQKHGVKVTWTNNIDSVYTALANGKGVIFHVGHDSKYHFTKGGHYIFLYGAKIENGVKKAYVFDPNGSNNYSNVLFVLDKSDGGIEGAGRGTGEDFGIISTN